MRWFGPDLFVYIVLTFVAFSALVQWRAPLPLPGAGCRVGYVQDGDTVEIICNRKASMARLIGIDTPELRGSCASESAAATAARRALSGLVRQARVTDIRIRGRDKYGRTLIRLSLDGQDAAALMIAAGHGRPYDGGARAGWCG